MSRSEKADPLFNPLLHFLTDDITGDWAQRRERVGAAEVRPRVRFRIWLYVLTLDVLRSLEPTLHRLIVKPPNTFPKY